jgi:hypothetical protein
MNKLTMSILCCMIAFAASAQESPIGPGLGPDAVGAMPPVIQPTWPQWIPGYTELDPDTGLHMTGTPQRIELAAYRLKITGKVDPSP